MKRHSSFQVNGLNNEFDSLHKGIEELTGKHVADLPPVDGVQEFATFSVKQPDGKYKIYKKLDGDYRVPKTDGTNIWWEAE